MALLAIVVGAGYYRIQGWRVPAELPSALAAPALGVVAALAVLIVWLGNPYLALLLVPAAHVWVLDARRTGLALPLAAGPGGDRAGAVARGRRPSSRSPAAWTWVPARHGSSS